MTTSTRLLKPPIRQEDGWRQQAACRDGYAEAWFPAGETLNATNAYAIEICKACPVQTDCLNHAFATDERHGIWGGTTEQQREAIRRRR